jgi:hypothetical protein
MSLLHDTLTLSLNNFFSQLEKVSGLPAAQLLELWKAPTQAKVPPKKTSSQGCVYVFQKGSRPGEQCGENVHTPESSYCKKHKKYEGEESKKSSILSEAKASASAAIKPVGKVAAAVLRISKNEYGNYEHKATGFVLGTDKKVFGKQVGDKVMLLTQNDLLVCKQYSLTYTPEAVAPLESTEPTEEEFEVPDQDIDEDQ